MRGAINHIKDNYESVGKSHERIKWIDSLKGFAIICVVLGHIVKGYMDAGVFAKFTNAMYDIYNLIYMFHMPLFFMISGCLFAKAYYIGNPPDRMLREKSYKCQLWNLILLYIIYDVLLGVFKILFGGYVKHQVNYRDILMIWAKPIQLYWYLYILIVLYVVFAISTIRNANQFMLLVVLICISIVSNFSLEISWFQVSRTAYYAFFFFFGIILERHEFKIGDGKLVRVFAVITLILIQIFWGKRPLCEIPVVKFIVGWGTSLSLIELFRTFSVLRENSVLNKCGQYCLEIYLLHTYIATANRNLLPKIGLSNFYVNIGANLLLSVGIPILITWVVRKLKLYSLMFEPNCVIKKIVLKKTFDNIDGE